MADEAPGNKTVAFRTDLANLREQVEAALDRSIDRCARCKVCDIQINAVMAAIGVEFDRLHAALEHAASAAAGSGEGTRLWMLDCGELVAKHRARAEAAEAKLAEVREVVTTFLAVRGNNTAASMTGARDLAEGIRQVLDRVPLETRRSDGKEGDRG